MKFMFPPRTLLIGLALLTSGVSFAQHKPAYQNVVRAKQKVMQVKQRVERIIRHGGGQGGDRCYQYRSYRRCVAAECQWQGRGEVGRCVSYRHGGGHHNYNNPVRSFHMENDTAAMLAMQGMTIALNGLANDINQATIHYYTPQFWYWKNRVCQKSNSLIVANQAAKVAAAIPPVVNIQPHEFNYIDQELIQVKQLMFCP